MKNTLIHMVNYEKTISDEKTIWKRRHDVRQLRKKISNILWSKEAYDMKILQSIIYVKEYFYMFFSTLKDIIQTKSKTNHWIS